MIALQIKEQNKKEIQFCIPDITEGRYDVYAVMQRNESVWGSTPYNVTVNEKDRQVHPIDLYGKNAGTFCVARNVFLKSNDKIKMEINDGMLTEGVPAVKEVYIRNADVTVKNKIESTDVLADKTILWLGSSVTFGMGADGYSMADYISEKHPGNIALKYAISGTTLVDDKITGGSYVERLKNDVWEGYKEQIDLVVVQLSTNDASQKKPLGELSSDPEHLDVTTVLGAIEYIIQYVREHFQCDVIFYTGSYYESDNYAKMVEALKQVADKYKIEIINLWDNEKMREIYGTEQYRTYMPQDGIHPGKAGYEKWWGPEFDHDLMEYFKI